MLVWWMWGSPVMHHSGHRISIAVACCLAALVAADGLAFAQAGSTGGTIGKTDKSDSGGDEAAPDHQRAKPKTPERDRPAGPRAVSIAGKWVWHGKCADDSEWAGTFDLEQHNDGTVSGSCSVTRESCSSVSGQVTANKATLAVGWQYSTGNLEFTIAGGGHSMSGWEITRGHGRCAYQARRS